MREEQIIKAFYEVMNEKRACEYCGQKEIDRFKSKYKRGYYKCGHYISVYRQTPFEFTKIKMANWLKLIDIEINEPYSLSSSKAAHILGVSQPAAFCALKKMREYLENNNDKVEKFMQVAYKSQYSKEKKNYITRPSCELT